MLTDNQKEKICSILAFGCDRDTAAGIAECSALDIAIALDVDRRFYIRVRRAEAMAELRHMQSILDATKDGKYWRASVWWLERRSPERFGHRAAQVVTPKQLEDSIIAFNDVLRRQFPTTDDQQRVDACLDQMHESIELILDVRCAESLTKRFPSLPQRGDSTSLNADVSETSQSTPPTDNGVEP